MEYRRLGKAGLQLSVLSYGSWVSFSQQIDDSNAGRLMSIAYDAGINFFDNAEAYAGGLSEEMMGRILKSYAWDRTTYCLSSKAFFGLYGKDNKPTQKGLSRKHLTDACHAALQRLQTDYLDLFYCHRPDPTVSIEEVVETMTLLIRQGKVLYWGTSEWSAAEIAEAQAIAEARYLIAPVVEQPQYNLFERTKVEADYLPLYASKYGLGTTIWSPLASGLLTGKYNAGIPADSRFALPNYAFLLDRWIEDTKIEKVRRLAQIATDLGTTVAILAIAWTLKNPHVTTTILGATKEAQLIENLKALTLYQQLTPDVMNAIEGIMANNPAISAI